MKGRLLPEGGAPVSLSINEVVKCAQAKAHRDASVSILRNTFSNLVKQAEGETGAALRSTVGSLVGPEVAAEEEREVSNTQVGNYGTSPDPSGSVAPPAGGIGAPRAPGAAAEAAEGLHAVSEKMASALSRILGNELEGMTELEKQAFVRRLLASGKNLASRMAAKGGTTGRVGKFLGRDVRSPVQLSRNAGGVSANVRSPLKAAKTPLPKTPPAIPKDAGPYRTPGKVSPGKVSPPADEVVDVTRHAKLVKDPKPKGLMRTLVPGALMLGAGYGVIKGVPAAANWASNASNAPMAYNGGMQQYQYGYTPNGQAQF